MSALLCPMLFSRVSLSLPSSLREDSLHLGFQGVAVWPTGHCMMGDRILQDQSRASGQIVMALGAGQAGGARPGKAPQEPVAKTPASFERTLVE